MNKETTIEELAQALVDKYFEKKSKEFHVSDDEEIWMKQIVKPNILMALEGGYIQAKNQLEEIRHQIELDEKSKVSEGMNPMTKQYQDLKAKHTEALLLFRCGDWYETYFEDAREASKILGISLKWDGVNRRWMTSFPHTALDVYLPKFIKVLRPQNRRIAICDMIEDPRLTKKLVKRGCTELASE